MVGLFENWTDPGAGELIESCTIIAQNIYPELSSIYTGMLSFYSVSTLNTG